MGRKLIRDFVPGKLLVSRTPINGIIREAVGGAERRILAAAKIVEEAKELQEAVLASDAARGDLDKIESEIGDVLEALLYLSKQFHKRINIRVAAQAKAKTHGRFTQNFVWEWEGDSHRPG